MLNHHCNPLNKARIQSGMLGLVTCARVFTANLHSIQVDRYLMNLPDEFTSNEHFEDEIKQFVTDNFERCVHTLKVDVD